MNGYARQSVTKAFAEEATKLLCQNGFDASVTEAEWPEFGPHDIFVRNVNRSELKEAQDLVTKFAHRRLTEAN